MKRTAAGQRTSPDTVWNDSYNKETQEYIYGDSGPNPLGTGGGKSVIFGFLVVIVACQRGLEARGGPRGVADGVNATVVLSVVSILGVNLVVTQLTTMFFPTTLA